MYFTAGILSPPPMGGLTVAFSPQEFLASGRQAPLKCVSPVLSLSPKILELDHFTSKALENASHITIHDVSHHIINMVQLV
jgi:hypothetical protein